MLAIDLVETLSRSGHEVLALDRQRLDVTDPDACQEAVVDVDVVANCAAWTDVDGAETHEAAAFAVNAVGAANLARACAATGASLVHLSTDYVFDGRGVAPYPTDQPLRPLNAYGRTKAAAEWAVRAECERTYVVRTAWLYGAHGASFPATMLRLAEEREVLQVVADQRGQPTWTADLAVFVMGLVTSGQPFDTYHGTSVGETTWYEFAREAFRLAGLDEERIHPTTSEAFPRPAARPAYSVLESSPGMPEWRDALKRALPELVAR
jgi:dTDP-4-dehydrorhamnose reductase